MTLYRPMPRILERKARGGSQSFYRWIRGAWARSPPCSAATLGDGSEIPVPRFAT